MADNAYVIVDTNPNPDGGTVCSLDSGRDPACEGPFVSFLEPVGDWNKPNIVLCAHCATEIVTRITLAEGNLVKPAKRPVKRSSKTKS